MLLTENDFEAVILNSLCEDTALAYTKYLSRHDFFNKTNEIDNNKDISYQYVNDIRADSAKMNNDQGIVDKYGKKCSLDTFIAEVLENAKKLRFRFDSKLLIKAATDYYNKR